MTYDCPQKWVWKRGGYTLYEMAIEPLLNQTPKAHNEINQPGL
jgi:hypothetical protein